jgi:hypothetical protein
MLALRQGDDDDPAKLVEAKELREREYLERATPNEKAEYLDWNLTRGSTPYGYLNSPETVQESKRSHFDFERSRALSTLPIDINPCHIRGSFFLRERRTLVYRVESR